MAEVYVSDGTLTVEMQGLDKLWALKSRLDIPMKNVTAVEINPKMAHGKKGFRVPGTHLPGVITAGTFILDGDRVFWNVRDPDQAIVIHLHDERYARLIVQVDEPAVTVATLQRALAPAR